ncbi:MAG: hypothetical protein ACQESJ_06640 [Bacteroidota bacterium]
MKTTKQILRSGTLAILSLAVVFALTNCKKSQKEGEDKTSEKKEKISKEEVKKQVEEVVYPIPTTFDITKKLNEIGAGFIIGISNDVENVDKYVAEDKQAMNLGVYSADLSYTSAYGMKQYTKDYMDVTKKMIQELGISGAFSVDFYDKVEKNLDNKEKLIDLISDSFYDTYEYMNKKDKEELSLLVVAGSWIEAMYITTHISETTYHNKEIVKLIENQEETLNDLLDEIKSYKEYEAINQIIEGLKPIKDTYENLDEDGFNKEQVMKIQKEIAELRNDLIS